MNQVDYETKKFLKFWLNTWARYMYLNGEQHSKLALGKVWNISISLSRGFKAALSLWGRGLL